MTRRVIARLWHGAVPTVKADAYHGYVARTGLTDYRATQGCRGAQVLRRRDGDRTHFLVLSYWESLDAIRAFAGPEVERARYYPEDGEYLLEFEPHVTHYEVLETEGDTP